MKYAYKQKQLRWQNAIAVVSFQGGNIHFKIRELREDISRHDFICRIQGGRDIPELDLDGNDKDFLSMGHKQETSDKGRGEKTPSVMDGGSF